MKNCSFHFTIKDGGREASVSLNQDWKITTNGDLYPGELGLVSDFVKELKRLGFQPSKEQEGQK